MSSTTATTTTKDSASYHQYIFGQSHAKLIALLNHIDTDRSSVPQDLEQPLYLFNRFVSQQLALIKPEKTKTLTPDVSNLIHSVYDHPNIYRLPAIAIDRNVRPILRTKLGIAGIEEPIPYDQFATLGFDVCQELLTPPESSTPAVVVVPEEIKMGSGRSKHVKVSNKRTSYSADSYPSSINEDGGEGNSDVDSDGDENEDLEQGIEEEEEDGEDESDHTQITDTPYNEALRKTMARVVSTCQEWGVRQSQITALENTLDDFLDSRNKLAKHDLYESSRHYIQRSLDKILTKQVNKQHMQSIAELEPKLLAPFVRMITSLEE